MTAVGVLMVWRHEDAEAATATLHRIAERGGVSVGTTADVVLGAAALGCKLDCGSL